MLKILKISLCTNKFFIFSQINATNYKKTGILEYSCKDLNSNFKDTDKY